MKLRRLAATDLAAFQAYRGDPDVGRWQGWTPQADEQALAFLNEMATIPLFQPGQWSQLAVADAQTDRLIGDLGIHVSADGLEAEFGFSLARAAQGRGIATAAVRAAIALVFEQTGVQRIHAQTDARNSACIRLLERLPARLLARIETEFRGEACVEWRYELAQR
ncbi:GNAT family N-acetyltransferase [Roseateles asaccharophilus]|uniref:Aminoglycoside 6'-N-acetyltransferase n=1 Tax=Roseateles asaccharophilus TaxID=582607 RepID=A0ABU2AIC7_9BURK|nr:GNAT family N-acetyltransferase [Roseateles asaccharophilus]MDR7335733.1 aminoglycoside 6'-N-acetyltransferase [Roseateles asaccharophilus]